MATLPNLKKDITKDLDPPITDTQTAPIPIPIGTTLLTTKLHNEIIDDLNSIIDYISGDDLQNKIPQIAIEDLSSDLEGKEDALGFTPEDADQKGRAQGYANLDNNIQVPNLQIPSLNTSKITAGVFNVDRIPNLTIDKIPDSLITLAKLSAGGTRDNTTFLRGDGTFMEIPSGDIGANVSLSNLSNTAITEHLNFGANVGLQTPLFQILQQNSDLFIQTKNANTRLYLTSESIIFDPNVATLFNNKRIGLVRNPVADDEAANKSYVDSEINDLDTGANKTLSNLDDPMALNQDITFSKVSPSIYLRAIDGGIHFNSYNILESATDLRIFENTNNEHGIIINPQLLQFVSSNDIDINNNKLLNVSTPTLDSDGATKKYVDDNSGSDGANTELSNLDPNTLINQELTFIANRGAIRFTGAGMIERIQKGLHLLSNNTLSGIEITDTYFRFRTESTFFNFNERILRGIVNPTQDQDAATKNYVDTEITGIDLGFSDLSGNLALTQIPDNLITLVKLNATGTRDNTTFLRGDGTFAVPQSGGIAGANTELSNLGVTAINTNLNLTGTNRLNFSNAGSIRPENNTNALGIYAGNTLTSLFDDNGIISYVPINMGSNKITALGTPTANDDAATKLYVDEHSGGTVNFNELEGMLANTQIPESEINLSKLNAVGSDGGLMFVNSDGTISQIGNNATINQILVWAGGGWQPRDQPVIPTPIIYANRNLSNLTDPVSFNQHLIFSVTDGEITFANGSQVSSSANPRIFGPGIQILSPSGLNGLIITDTAIGFELLSENRKEIHFGNLKLMNALDPTSDQDVATKHYVDNHAGIGGATTALSNLTTTAIDQELIFADGSKGITFALGGKLNHTTGGVRIRGGDEGVLTSIITLAPTEITLFSVLGLNMSDKKITNLLTPSNDKDAATKKYVDDIDGGANATLSNLGTTALNDHLNFAIPQGQINFMDGSSIRGNTLGILIQGSQADNHSFIFLNDLEFNFHSATDEFNFNSAKLSNVLDPTDNQQAATKHYVDTHAGIGGANTELSNLDANTLIDQDLTFSGIGKGIVFPNNEFIRGGTSTQPTSSIFVIGSRSHNTYIQLSGIGGLSLNSETGSISVNNDRIVLLANPISLTDATNKFYVDSEITDAISEIDLGFSDLSGTIGLNQIPNQAITESKYQNNSISTEKLQNNSITTEKLQNLSITELKLQNGSISTGKLQNNSITTEKLQNLSITGAKIAVKSININKLSVSSGESLDKGICLYNLENTDFTLGGLQDVSGKLLLSQINQSEATDGQVLKWSDASSAFVPSDP